MHCAFLVNSPDGIRASKDSLKEVQSTFKMGALRSRAVCRPGLRVASRCSAMSRTRMLCRISDRAPINQIERRHGTGHHPASLHHMHQAVSAALHAYENLRRERVAGVQRGARENGFVATTSFADDEPSAMRKSPRNLIPASGCLTTMMWCRKRRKLR